MSAAAVLRLAARELAHARSRGLLLAALVALPVAAATTADVVVRSAQLTPSRFAQRELGGADARIRARAGVAPGTLQKLLPPGSRLLPDATLEGLLVTRSGAWQVDLCALPYTRPLAQGILEPLAGRAPRGPREVAVSPQLASRAGVGLGDTLELARPAVRLTVVGLVADPTWRDHVFACATPAALHPHGAERAWLVRWPKQPPAGALRSLRRRGFSLERRAALLHPRWPDTSLRHAFLDGFSPETLGTGILAAGLGLFEVVLLAAAAVSIGTRRRRAQLRLLAACGAAPRQLAGVVLAASALVGLVGSLAGSAAGIVAGHLLAGPYARWQDQQPGGFQLHPPELALFPLAGLAASLAAAALPALEAAGPAIGASPGRLRAALRGARFAAALLVLGAAVAAAAALGGGLLRGDPLTAAGLAGGCALVQTGLALLGPRFFAACARGSLRLPLLLRVALREAAQPRSGAAAAAVVVLAAVAASAGAATYLASLAEHHRLLGPHAEGGADPYAGGKLALLAAATAVALLAGVAAAALAEAERLAETALLAAAGASPRTLRLLAAARAAVVTSTGAALGLIAGVAAAAVLVLALRHATWRAGVWPLVLPGWTLLAIALLAPAVAMLAAWLLAPAADPRRRRAA